MVDRQVPEAYSRKYSKFDLQNLYTLEIMGQKFTFFVLPLLIFTLGFFFRMYKFDSIPLGLNHDGAQDALQSIELMRKPWPISFYLPGGSGETLFKYYLAVIMKLTGISVWSIKFGAGLISMATLPFFYLFVKTLYNKTLALCSTLLLAVSGWHIIMGKTVWRAISTPLVEVIALYFLVITYREHKKTSSILCGFFTGLTLYTYNGARSIPLFVLTILVLFLCFGTKQIYVRLKLFVLFLLTFAVVSTPLLWYAAGHWDEFNSRLASLSVIEKVQKSGNLNPLWVNLQTTAGIFTQRANGDDFFTVQPLLDQPTRWLFVLGLIVCCINMRKREYAFTLLGLVIHTLPGFISVPNGNRNIAMLPFIYLISGIGFYTILKLIKTHTNRQLQLLTAALVGIFAIGTTYYVYFSGHRTTLWGFYPETTVVGNFMQKNPQYSFYLTDNFPRDALTFLTYRGGSPWIKHYVWKENKEELLDLPIMDHRLVFIMFPSEENSAFITTRLKKRFPTGTASFITYKEEGRIKKSAALIYKVH